MKQQHPTPSSAADEQTSLATTPIIAEGAQHLILGAGQGRLVWVDAGCELRSLSGTTLLHTTATPGIGQPPPRLPPHAAWRSPQGAWISISAGSGACATLALTAPSAMPCGPAYHEKSRPERGALQRLWHSVRKMLVRREQPAS